MLVNRITLVALAVVVPGVCFLGWYRAFQLCFLKPPVYPRPATWSRAGIEVLVCLGGLALLLGTIFLIFLAHRAW